MQGHQMSRKMLTVVLVLLLMFCPGMLSGCADVGQAAPSESKEEFTIAMAWTDAPEKYSIKCMNIAMQETGENSVGLDMIRSYDLSYDKKGMLKDAKDKMTGALSSDAARLVKENNWLNSNAEEVMDGVDCVIFPGGSDISPSLYYKEKPWHGIEEEKDYSAERDVSDYLLMSYCLDHDIPVLAICRGMQMLSVVSGAELIQDIPTWLDEQGIKYENLHRDAEKKDLVPHEVKVKTKDSLLYEITGSTELKGCPSWHHQAVGDVSNTRLTVAGETDTQGIPMVEAVERKDRSFCLGLQFHPEVAIAKNVEHEENAGDFMDYDTAISFFHALVEAGKVKDEELDKAA